MKSDDITHSHTAKYPGHKPFLFRCQCESCNLSLTVAPNDGTPHQQRAKKLLGFFYKSISSGSVPGLSEDKPLWLERSWSSTDIFSRLHQLQQMETPNLLFPQWTFRKTLWFYSNLYVGTSATALCFTNCNRFQKIKTRHQFPKSQLTVSYFSARFIF